MSDNKFFDPERAKMEQDQRKLEERFKDVAYAPHGERPEPEIVLIAANNNHTQKPQP